jgi:flagellar biosynthesis/type III secretory pathway protein FliH
MPDTSHMFRPIIAQIPGQPDPTSGDAGGVIDVIDMTNADAVDRLAKDLAERAKKIRADKRQAELKARREAEAKRHSEHYARMFEDIGQGVAGLNEAQHGIVYAQAYEQGHAYGYSEVELHYGELAEMARKLLDAR